MDLLTNIRQECHTLVDELSDEAIIELWDTLRAWVEPQAKASASEVFEGNQAQSEQLQEG